ncbi:PIN domain-containing protein [candidate division KSB1 bacterium]|nr:PIN domain-containing protein [candidate division KSB1 bacterium]
MFAIDTNILVYAHNKDSEFNNKATVFLEKVMNDRDEDGNLSVCIPTQVLIEFINVMTGHNLKFPLSIPEAIKIIQDYLDTDIQIISQRETQIQTFLELLASVTTRKKVFDVVLAATLKDNNISGLYTLNVKDFDDFCFLKIINPLEDNKKF